MADLSNDNNTPRFCGGSWNIVSSFVVKVARFNFSLQRPMNFYCLKITYWGVIFPRNRSIGEETYVEISIVEITVKGKY